MSRIKKNEKARIVSDDPKRQHEYESGFMIKRIETVSGIRYQTNLGTIEGKRTRPSFKTLTEARECAKARKREIDGHGIKAQLLTKPQRADAAAALATLKDFKVDLQAAAAFYAKHHQTVDSNNGVSHLIESYLGEMERRVTDGTLRPTTYKDSISRLKPLKDTLGHLAIDAVSDTDLQKMLTKYKPLNRANYQRYFSMFFRWAVRKKLIKGNPVELLAPIPLNANAPEIYTPDQVRSVMKEIAKNKGEQRQILPYMALAFFAGIRPDELTRLNWKDISLTDGVIHVRADVSKTKKARFIEMPKNLRQWLAICPNRKGLVFPFPDSARRRWRKEVHKTAKVPLIRDGARHSMATYYMAEHTIEETTDILGHSNEVLFKHYKGLVKGKKSKAKAYFDIKPGSAKVMKLERKVA